MLPIVEKEYYDHESLYLFVVRVYEGNEIGMLVSFLYDRARFHLAPASPRRASENTGLSRAESIVRVAGDPFKKSMMTEAVQDILDVAFPSDKDDARASTTFLFRSLYRQHYEHDDEGEMEISIVSPIWSDFGEKSIFRVF